LRPFPKIKKHPYKIIAFDWDGTAVVNRKVDASPVAEVLEELMKRDVYIVVITGTNFGNIDRQFSSLIKGPHKKNLFIMTDRGSEVHGFSENSEPVLLYGRRATDQENELLSRVAEAVKHEIESQSNATIDIVYDRLNRRKIDLIPEWENPPKEQIGELLEKTEERLEKGGFKGGIKRAFNLAFHYAEELGLEDARVTSDVKHVEVGLTDKSDSIRWVVNELAKKRNIPFRDMLVLGDEFGPIAGFEGSDFLTYLPDAPDITYVSVGKEPNGVPAGVIHVGGGPACFMDLMKEQVELYKKLSLTDDPTFLLVEEEFEPLREREIESMFTVGNGYLGTRGALEERIEGSEPTTLIAGVYDRPKPKDIDELAIVPDWVYTKIYVDGVQLKIGERNLIGFRRVLDMKKGIYQREWRHKGDKGRVTSIKFVRTASLADQHIMGMRITVVPENYEGEIRVETGFEHCFGTKYGLTPEPVEMGSIEKDRGALIVARTRFTGVKIAQAQLTQVAPGFVKQHYRTYQNKCGAVEDWTWRAEAGQALEIEKFVSIYTSRDTEDPVAEATKKVREYTSRGFNEMLLESVEEWERRWDVAAITLEGDAEGQKWYNFAGYHLIIAGTHLDEYVSISARSLSGPIYKGHIFWDTEIFMLPFFIYTHPPTARALIMYRYHTLPGARKEAQDAGLDGVLFPWESTVTGEEMTPEYVIAPTGEVILIMTGKMEQHINADVAYGVWSYWTATRDEEFFVNAGVEILIETARFWASRVEERDGVYHIYNIEGPDEYHEVVDDNTYTNVLAAWNMDRAAEAISFLKERYPDKWRILREKVNFDESELNRWEDVSNNIYKDMGNNNLIEQFAGFFELKDIDVYDYEPRTAPLDTILGREETAQSQLVKQADVVLLLYLLENEFSEEVIKENYVYYERRTGHGSSLSPGTYGLVAARLGLMDLAMRYFEQAGTIDLSNNMGNAAGGVHAAALGGFWQLIVMGFAGVRAMDEGVFVYPNMPERWKRLKFSIVWRGNHLDFDVEHDKQITVSIGDKSDVKLGIFGKDLQELESNAVYKAEWDGSTWREFTKIGQRGVA